MQIFFLHIFLSQLQGQRSFLQFPSKVECLCRIVADIQLTQDCLRIRIFDENLIIKYVYEIPINKDTVIAIAHILLHSP